MTRYSVKDSSRHVILGTQQFKPVEFGQQINLNMDNAWGVVRCILDIIMQQKVEIMVTAMQGLILQSDFFRMASI